MSKLSHFNNPDLINHFIYSHTLLCLVIFREKWYVFIDLENKIAVQPHQLLSNVILLLWYNQL